MQKIRKFKALTNHKCLNYLGEKVQATTKGKVYSEYHNWRERSYIPRGFILADNSVCFDLGTPETNKLFKEVEPAVWNI